MLSLVTCTVLCFYFNYCDSSICMPVIDYYFCIVGYLTASVV
jgi:hypothetical protein